jgi:hypothetical protein
MEVGDFPYLQVFVIVFYSFLWAILHSSRISFLICGCSFAPNSCFTNTPTARLYSMVEIRRETQRSTRLHLLPQATEVGAAEAVLQLSPESGSNSSPLPSVEQRRLQRLLLQFPNTHIQGPFTEMSELVFRKALSCQMSCQ